MKAGWFLQQVQRAYFLIYEKDPHKLKRKIITQDKKVPPTLVNLLIKIDGSQ